jgi:hypothetical protein
MTRSWIVQERTASAVTGDDHAAKAQHHAWGTLLSEYAVSKVLHVALWRVGPALHGE